VGRIRYVTSCLTIFAFAALLCAAGQSLWELIGFRAVLGFAEGGFFLGGLLTIFSNVPARVLPFLILGYAALSQCSSAVAPLLAGTIVNDDSWRILYIALGLGAAIAAVLLNSFASTGALDRALRLGNSHASTDFVGLGLLAVFIAAFAYAMAYGEQRDWLSGDDVAFALQLLALAGIAFVAWERFGVRDPVFPFAVFRERNAWIGMLLALAIGVPLFGTLELLRYLVGALSFPLEVAGQVIAIRAIALIFSAPLGSALVARGIDSRFVIAAGFSLSALAFAWEATGITSASAVSTFIGPELLVGFGFGLTYAPLLVTVVSNVNAALIPVAVALVNVTFVLPGSFANAALGTLFDHRQSTHWSNLASSLSLSRPVIREAMKQHPAATPQLLAALLHQQSAVLAFVDVALGCAAVAGIAVPFALILHPAKKIGPPNVESVSAASEVVS
jgi:DHA2 family multidrug resistance protein